MATLDDFTWDAIALRGGDDVRVVVIDGRGRLATDLEILQAEALEGARQVHQRLVDFVRDGIAANPTFDTGTPAAIGRELHARRAEASALIAGEVAPAARDNRRRALAAIRSQLQTLGVAMLPDGTLAVPLEDLRAMLDGLDALP